MLHIYYDFRTADASEDGEPPRIVLCDSCAEAHWEDIEIVNDEEGAPPCDGCGAAA